MAASSRRHVARRRRHHRRRLVYRSGLRILFPETVASHLGWQGHGRVAAGAANGEGEGEVGRPWRAAFPGRGRWAERANFLPASARAHHQVLEDVGTGLLRAADGRAQDIRYVRGRPVRRFERKSPAREPKVWTVSFIALPPGGPQIPFDQREADLHMPDPPNPPPTVYRSRFMGRRSTANGVVLTARRRISLLSP